MTEALLILRTDEEFGTFQHFLHHHPRSTLYLHHPVVFQCQMFGSTDVQCHTAYVALVDRTDNLCDNRIAHLLSESKELVFSGAYHLWY